MEAEPLVVRDEPTSMLLAISDISKNVQRMRDLLEEELGGEEGLEEDLS